MEHEPNRAGSLTCRKTTYLVSESRDRNLTTVELQSLQQHIAGCAHCSIASKRFDSRFSQLDELLARHEK